MISQPSCDDEMINSEFVNNAVMYSGSVWWIANNKYEDSESWKRIGDCVRFYGNRGL